jgi:hypothetical protein
MLFMFCVNLLLFLMLQTWRHSQICNFSYQDEQAEYMHGEPPDQEESYTRFTNIR